MWQNIFPALFPALSFNSPMQSGMQGINVIFYMDRRPGDSEKTKRSITCEVHYIINGKRERFSLSTKQSCQIQHFDQAEQRVKPRVNFSTQTNDRLHEFRDRAERIYRDAIERGTMPTPAQFKDLIRSGIYQVEQERDLLTDLLAFIEYHKGKKTHRGSMAHITILHKHLSEFGRRERYPIEYGKINLDFYGRFVRFLRARPSGKNGSGTYNENTVGNYVKKLKMFLNWSAANGWNKFHAYKHAEFKIPGQRVENIYLERHEIEALYRLDLRKRQSLGRARDWFVLACETGMRYGDYVQVMNEQNIREIKDGPETVGYDFHYFPTKTSKSSGIKCVVPLSQIAVQILRRYGFEIPKPVKGQVFNRQLKELVGMAGIEKDISSHDARRTFATLRYKDGFPVQSIMKITGHRTEREFYKYLLIDGEENAAQWRVMNDRYKVETPGLKEVKLKVV